MAILANRWYQNLVRPTFRVSAKLALYSVDRQRVLMMHYRDGHYGLPGGHIEKGESPETTLRREIMEEVGIEVGPVVRKDFFEREDSIILAFTSFAEGADPELKSPKPKKEEGVWLTRSEVEALERILPAYKAFALEQWPL